VGALAPLASGVVVGGLLALVTGAGMAGTLAAVSEAPGDGAGAVAFGVQFLAVGLASVGIAAVAAQVAATSRTANTIGVLVVVAGYALRGIADVRDDLGWLRWLSPVGWAQAIDPFGANDYAPALLCLALAVVGTGAAARLSVGRDLGAGLVQPRPGPASAPRLRSPLALAGRLQGTAVVSWALSAGAYALLVGLILESADDIVGDNADAERLIENLGGSGRLQDVMAALILSWIGVAAAAFGVWLATQLKSEESSGRTEVALATRVSRAAQLGAGAVVSIAGVLVILACSGVLMAIGHGATGGGWGRSFADALSGAGVQAPAALVVAGLALAVYGWVAAARGARLGRDRRRVPAEPAGRLARAAAVGRRPLAVLARAARPARRRPGAPPRRPDARGRGLLPRGLRRLSPAGRREVTAVYAHETFTQHAVRCFVDSSA
jgi:ABC-2 type transport system permease protein